MYAHVTETMCDEKACVYITETMCDDIQILWNTDILMKLISHNRLEL